MEVTITIMLEGTMLTFMRIDSKFQLRMKLVTISF